MNEESAVNAFAALSNKSRLRVLKALVEAGPEGMTAGEIARAIDASPSRTSFHLTAMAENGLISSQRQSRQIIYQVRFETVGELVQYLLFDCCRNNSIVRSCCELKKCC